MRIHLDNNIIIHADEYYLRIENEYNSTGFIIDAHQPINKPGKEVIGDLIAALQLVYDRMK